MTGIELILSAVCNITSCAPNDVLLPVPIGEQVHYPSAQIEQGLDIKVARQRVNGKHFKVGTLNDGLRSRAVVADDGKITGRGIAFSVLDELSNNLNFTYEVVLPQSYSEMQNNNFGVSSLLGMVIDHKIDIAAAFIPYSTRRKDLISFSLETDLINCLILPHTKLKVNADRNLMYTTQPFYANVWWFFLLTLTIYVACLMLLTRLRSVLINDDDECFTLSSSLSYIYRVITKQDIPNSPKASMTRILLITWSLFVILVSTYYSAHLSGGYTLTAVTGADSNGLGSRILKDNSLAVEYIEGSGCYSKFIPQHEVKRPSGFAFRRNTSLNILFDKEIRRMYYYGFLQKQYDQYVSRLTKMCPTPMSSGVYQVKPYDLAVVYYCWMAGVVSATAVFVAELVFKKLSRSKVAVVTRRCSEDLDNISVVDHDVTPPLCRVEIPGNQPSPQFQQRIVNGRRYLVTRTRAGDVRLVPVDTLSALLYDLNLYENA